MKISLNWLKECIPLDPTLDVDALADIFTMLGLEIESIERTGGEITNVVVGQIISMEPHPDADKLSLCRTDVGEAEPLSIVCGAKNMKPGDKVPTAKLGGSLPGGITIAKRKMRGHESCGMMCSASELNLGDGEAGLLILPPDAPIGMDILSYLGLSDAVFEIEVTPNRNDWSSMLGVAREIAARLGLPFTIPPVPTIEQGDPVSTLSSVTIDAPDLCPRYAGRVLTDVKVGPSPDWMQRRLAAAGQRSINNVVDITNYVLLETGHPLHAFDYDKLQENRIVARRAAQGESITTLDGQVRALTPETLVIADAKNPVALAGVMGGLDSEVTLETTRIFLESACFNPVSIRRTARAQNLVSEAAQRFQRGADPEMVVHALDRAAQLMRELAGANVAPGVIDAHPAPAPRRSITLRYARTGALLGKALDAEEQKRHLISLGFALESEDVASATFTVPTWRHDCTLEADLIEEVGRLHGFDNIEASMPRARRSEMVFAPQEQRILTLTDLLARRGLTEARNMTFSSPDELRRFGLGEMADQMVMLANPMSENHAGMRTSLLPRLVANVSANLRHGASCVRLFETGPVYAAAPGAELPRQSMRLAVALAGSREPQSWSIPGVPVDFHDMKGVAEDILEFAGVPAAKTAWAQAAWEPFREGASCRCAAAKTHLGYLGELAPRTAKACELEVPVFCLEFDLDALFAFDKPTTLFAPITIFPPALRDMAVLVDDTTPASDILASINASGGKFLRKVDVFDIYTGKQVPEGKKSVALSFVFQSPENTLTEKVTQGAWDSIFKRLQKDFGAVLR